MQLPPNIKDFLEEKYRKYASSEFIASDPIQIPHRYENSEDIEIAGFISATLAWGQRPQIVKAAANWLNQMGESPYEFIMEANSSNLKAFENFYYRTFNGVDCIAFLTSLIRIYRSNSSLQKIFTAGFQKDGTVLGAISYFRKIFIDSNFPNRSQKHVPNVLQGSSAKKINMFLRWMVRSSREGVDLGIWNGIPPSALMLPLDTHSGRVARSLGLLSRKQNDWKAVEEVTSNLRLLNKEDPVKYDFALFGLGIFEKF